MFPKPLFLAEVALSHEGSVGNACSLIELAKNNNLDIVKFQDHWARYESSNMEEFRVKIGIDQTRYDYWQRTSFNSEEWAYIYEFANNIEIKLSFSVFSVESFFRQKKLGNKIWKIGSGELLNLELVELMIKYLTKEDTIILSTGLSDFNYGFELAKKFSPIVKKVYVLDCISEYPCNINDYDMRSWMDNFKNLNNISFGLSDHSGTVWPTIFSWSCGAMLNEFHITFNKNLFGPDQKASLDPNDLKVLSEARDSYLKLSSSNKECNLINKEKMAKLFGRSIGFKNSLKKGHLIEKKDLIMRKPAGGFSYNEIDYVIGKVLKKDVDFMEILQPYHLSEN